MSIILSHFNLQLTAIFTTMRKLKPHIIYLLLILLAFTQCSENEKEDTQAVRIFGQGIPFLVGPETGNSTFSFYNTSPESPDGKLIVYVKILIEQNSEYQSLNGELWVCDTSLFNHQKISDLDNFISHNGVEAQWIDNNKLIFFDNGLIKGVNLQGQPIFSPFPAFSISREPKGNKFLYSKIASETNQYTILEFDISTNTSRFIANASSLTGIANYFTASQPRPLTDWRIRHLSYSPNGEKIAFRLDIGATTSTDRHVVTMNTNGQDIKFFGPQPMHFDWFDNNSIMGHDDIINDGQPNDKSTRRWTLNGEFIETLAGPGNHLSANTNRSVFATESWYNSNPVVLRAYKRGQTTPFWQETVSIDDFTVWDWGNHVNPAFSRDGKRIYYHKNTAPGKSQAYMLVLPNN